jgi:hypothetical protein
MRSTEVVADLELRPWLGHPEAACGKNKDGTEHKRRQFRLPELAFLLHQHQTSQQQK